MTSFDPIAYINEPRWHHSSLGLERITLLLHKLGDPQDDFLTVHVAGTNGKGSTCAYLASILQASGLRTGLFTSPYIEHFEERIQVDGESIGLDELIAITLLVRDAAEDVETELGEHPTEFELMGAVGFMHFARAGCDIAVVECGLGGRLDATNVVHPVLSVITRIGLDHTDILGDTLAAIATEKAGIIKPGVPVVSAPQALDVACVIEEHCRETGSPLFASDYEQLDVFGADDVCMGRAEFKPKEPRLRGLAKWNARPSVQGNPLARRLGYGAPCSGSPRSAETFTGQLDSCGDRAKRGNTRRVNLRADPISQPACELVRGDDASERDHAASSVPMRCFSYRGIQYETQLLAAYQPKNAAVAIDGATVLATWHPELGLSEQAIEEGIARATWPGRFEVIATEPLMIIDGAHNPDGASALAESVGELLGGEGPKATLVIGVLADKDWKGVLAPMLPFAHQVVAYAPDNPRALSAGALAQGIDELAAQQGLSMNVTEVPNVQEAIALALEKESPEGIVIAFGTLYSIGAIKQAVRAYSSLGVSRP